MLAAGAVAAAAVVVAGTIIFGGGSARTSHTRAATAPTGRSAHAFLLAMASKAAHGTTGKYWCSKWTVAWLYEIGPHNAALPTDWTDTHAPASAPTGYRYSICDRSVTAQCLGQNQRIAGGYRQGLGVIPASATDTAAWRQDGSPSEWTNGPMTFSTHEGRREDILRKSTQSPGPDYMTLPADPAKLKAALMAHLPGLHSSQSKALRCLSDGSPRQVRDMWLWEEASGLLVEPVTNGTRAAAFRLLAALPELQLQPNVKMPDGTVGTAFWVRKSPSSICIVDPNSGNVIGQEAVTTRQTYGLPAGTAWSYETFSGFRWFNHLPGWAHPVGQARR